MDYIRYVIKPKVGEAYLELWFGPYALNMMPNDEQFTNSDKFEQRNIVDSGGRLFGVDSWGQQHDGRIWRRTAVGAQGGTYQDVSPEQARLFDQIMNSLCEVPYPNQQ